MPVKTLPSAEYLRECFDYDPQTGMLRWRVRPKEHFAGKRHWAVTTWNAQWAGKIVGNLSDRGYRTTAVDGVNYRVSRLIWKLMTGEDPLNTVDHRNGKRDDNRWDNLRVATQAQQMFNTGRRGIYQQDGRWRVRIAKRSFGMYGTYEEALAVYEREAHILFGEFYRK